MLKRTICIWLLFVSVAYGIAQTDQIKSYFRNHIGHDDYELRDDLINGRYFSRRSSFNTTDGTQLDVAETVDIMLDVGNTLMISRSVEVYSDCTNLKMRYLSNPTHNGDGIQNLNTAHISQTLALAGDNIFSISTSQINPTITDVGFEGAPFYIRATGGAGNRQITTASGNIGLLMPGTTISLRMTNQGAQACNVDVLYTFTEIRLPVELL